MRRIGVILASLAIFLVAAPPAGAHPLVTSFEVPVGRPATITMQVPAETQAPMSAVDIELPRDFRLERVTPQTGWTATTTDGPVHLEGPPLPLGATLIVSLRGTFERKGEILFPVVTHAADGTDKRWGGPPGSGRPAAVAYAGVKPPGTGDGGGVPAATLAGAALVGLGAVGAVALVLRRRRLAHRVDQLRSRPGDA